MMPCAPKSSAFLIGASAACGTRTMHAVLSPTACRISKSSRVSSGPCSPSMNSQSKPNAASTSADAPLASVTIVPSNFSRRFNRARNSFVMAASAMIDDDLAALHDDGDVHEIEDQLQRIAVDDREIGDVARRDGTELVRHLDERGRVRTHELDDVARREHQVQHFQLVVQTVDRQVVRVGAETVDDAVVPERPRVDGFLAGGIRARAEDA